MVSPLVMWNILADARKIQKEGNIRELGIRTLGLIYRKSIRRVLPIQGLAIWSGVKVPTGATHPRKLYDEYLPVPFHYSIRPTAEGGEVRGHRIYTRDGDQVVIIGGGRGISSVIAARNAKPSGSVLVYEGSTEFADLVRETAKINQVSEYVCVIERSVGPEIEIYGKSTARLPVAELPECDVLELDCEGAEKQIIEDMVVSPRVLIVEMHPVNFDHPAVDAVLKDIESRGYEIAEFMTNKGETVNRCQFVELLAKNRFDDGEAPVVVAVKCSTPHRSGEDC